MGTTNLKFAVGDHIDFLTYLNILVIDIFKGNYELMDGSGKRKKLIVNMWMLPLIYITLTTLTHLT